MSPGIAGGDCDHIRAATRRIILRRNAGIAGCRDDQHTTLSDRINRILQRCRTVFEQPDGEVDYVSRIVVPDLVAFRILGRDQAACPPDGIIDVGETSTTFAERAHWNDFDVPRPARDP